jgi:hypothetical protein
LCKDGKAQLKEVFDFIDNAKEKARDRGRGVLLVKKAK